MSKLKWIKHIINIILWTTVGLYLLIAVVMRVPAVQNAVAEKMAEVIGQQINTKVEIGRIDLGLLNRVVIDNTTIYDQRGKVMVKSARIAVKIDLLQLIEGKVRISSAQMFATNFHLYKLNEKAKSNFQFVIDALASKDSTKEKKPLDIAINSYIMRRCNVSYDRWDKPKKNGLLDPNHIRLSDISTYVMLKALRDDSINVEMRKLTLKEQSGLRVDDMRFNLVAGTKTCLLKDFELRMPNSVVRIERLDATYNRKGGKTDPKSLTYSGHLNNSEVTPADIAAIVPGLRSFTSKVEMDILLHGSHQRIDIDSIRLTSTSGDLGVNASGWYEDTKPHKSWGVNIDRLIASPKTIEFLVKNINGKTIEIPDVAYRLGDIDMRGKASSTPDGTMDARLAINSEAGKADVNVNIKDDNADNRAREFTGNVTAHGVALNKITQDTRLGNIDTDISVEGCLRRGALPTVSAKGVISRFAYNGYSFSNIDIDGLYDRGDISGTVNINDPNIALKTEGHYGKAEDKRGQTLVIDMDIERLRPAAIKLSNKWGNANFSAKIGAELTASGMNDSNGTVSISDFNMTAQGDSCHIGQLQIRSGFDVQGHYLVMESDFGYAMLVGNFDYPTLPASITRHIEKHLPAIMKNKGNNKKTGDNNFTLIAHVNDTKWVKPLLGLPLTTEQPLLLRANMDDNDGSMTIECDAPDITYDNMRLTDSKLYVYASEDNISIKTQTKKHQYNGDIIDCHVSAKADDDIIDASLTWDNPGKIKGELNALSTFGKNDNGQDYAKVKIKPSVITIGEKTWRVKASDVMYAKNNLDINDFRIEHESQHIIINGKASNSQQDSLFIDLNGVDVRYVLDLVNFHSVDFDGFASGKALVVAPFGDMQAKANLTVDRFFFEHGRMGVLTAEVNWNNAEKQIDIDAIANDGPDARTIINGYVSPKRNYIDLDIEADSTHIDFMHSFTKSFISDIDGRAKGKVKLAGPLNNINLTGMVVVNGNAMIRPLNCRYYLENDTITLIPDEIELRNVRIKDVTGNVGFVNGNIHHKHLTRLSYDLNVRAQNLLAYDFRDFGNEVFYGTVYADGNVDITGRSGFLQMDVDVTPLRGSSFVYNASTNDQIYDQEFIAWNDVTPRYNGSEMADKTKTDNDDDNEYSSDMFINFNINCTPDAQIKLLMDSHTGDYITMYGNGMIRATYYNKGAFNMFGTYTMDHGTYDITIQNIIKKNFTFQEGGTFVFGGNPYDATLNLQAVYTVNGVSLSDLNVGNSFTNNTTKVNCLMNIGGVARNPQVSFDLDMPTVSSDEKQMIRSVLNSEDELNQQVVYLLGIGRFYPTGTNNSTSREQSETSLAMQSLLSGTISSQISSVLNTVIKNDNWNFGANISTGDEGWNNAEYEGIVNGRLLNNRLLINGQFGYKDNVNTASTNFIGDFDIRYLLFPNGNLALKVYNQTNDRYFTKSSLNTQGIGLIMKKDFKGLGDLIGKKKKKKKTNKVK